MINRYAMFAMEFVILFFHILQITFYAYGHDWQQKSNPETNLTASENIFKLIFINSTVSDKEKLEHYGLEQLARLYSSCSVPICEGQSLLYLLIILPINFNLSFMHHRATYTSLSTGVVSVSYRLSVVDVLLLDIHIAAFSRLFTVSRFPLSVRPCRF